jgi:hypothetical protein
LIATRKFAENRPKTMRKLDENGLKTVEVFSGDLGNVARVDTEARELLVNRDGRDVAYGFGEPDER